MARQLRIEFPGAFYHVMARGNEKQDIYRDRHDRLKFLGYLESSSARYGAVIHCYCLMGNHYHLLVETPNGNLAQIMRHINGAYTSYFNARHERVGHLFQGRYGSILVDSDSYYLALSRYIHLNPVKEGLSINPWEYEWSSCRYFTGCFAAPAWLRKKFILAFFNNSGNAEDVYLKYLISTDNDVEELFITKTISGMILGSASFIEKVQQEHLHNVKVNRDLPAVKGLKARVKIQTVYDVVLENVNNDKQLARKMSIYMCHSFSGYQLKEIGEFYGVGESAVTEASNRFATLLCSDQRLAEVVAEVLVTLNL